MNINLKIMLIVVIDIFLSMSLLCQTSNGIKLTHSRCKYIIEGQEINVIKIKVKNEIDGDNIVWLDSSINSFANDNKKLHSYFHKIKEDFSLYQLMVQKMIDDKHPVIFGSLLIKLSQGEVFTFNIVNCSDQKKDIIFNYFKYHLINFPYSELKHQLKLSDDYFVWYNKESIEIMCNDIISKAMQ